VSRLQIATTAKHHRLIPASVTRRTGAGPCTVCSPLGVVLTLSRFARAVKHYSAPGKGKPYLTAISDPAATWKSKVMATRDDCSITGKVDVGAASLPAS